MALGIVQYDPLYIYTAFSIYLRGTIRFSADVYGVLFESWSLYVVEITEDNLTR